MLDATSLPRGYAVRCNIVAIQYSTVRKKIKIQLYISPDVGQLGTRLVCYPDVAGSIPLCTTIFLPTIFACWHIRLYR